MHLIENRKVAWQDSRAKCSHAKPHWLTLLKMPVSSLQMLGHQTVGTKKHMSTDFLCFFLFFLYQFLWKYIDNAIWKFLCRMQLNPRCLQLYMVSTTAVLSKLYLTCQPKTYSCTTVYSIYICYSCNSKWTTYKSFPWAHLQRPCADGFYRLITNDDLHN